METCPTCGSALQRADDTCPHCSTQALPAAASSFPAIPGYRILRRLGEGGMGQVFLAEDVQLGRRVAIKLISERVSSDAAMSSRFLREARLLATIEHPHVVRVYSFGQVEARQYLVMEYVEGESLAALIRREGPLPVETALRILRETVEGLEAAQELHIVHRDIKPANILLDRRGRVRVADFGLAKQGATTSATDSSITQAGYVLGSPHYLSPEQAQGQVTDFRSDLYSLGVVLYEMLTGERPFEGSTPIAIVARHLHDPLPPIRSRRADVPMEVAVLIERLTAKDREQRPRSYADMLAAIEAVGPTASPDSAPTLLQGPAAAPPSPPRWQTQGLAMIILIAAVLIVVAIIKIQKRLPEAGPTARNVFDDRRLRIAVTPFYGPDADSEKEGRVMAALVERSIGTRLGRDEVRVLGIDETRAPVRSHEEARALAKKLGAHVVVWGEAFSLRGETEIQPYITAVELSAPSSQAASPDANRETASLERLTESETGAVRLAAEAPNQIELRKTSAEGVGQMASYLAGIYALHRENDALRALRLFEQAPQSIDVMRQKAQAYIVRQEYETAIELLRQVVSGDPDAHEARAQLADMLMLEGRTEEAIPHYRALATVQPPVPTRNGAFQDGLLLVRDLYRSRAFSTSVARDSGNLLAVDPGTGVVRRRWGMPGMIQRFIPRDGGVVIEYRDRDSASAPTGSLEYRNGGFARPLLPPASLLLRMNSMRSGWIIAANFVGDLIGPAQMLPPVAAFRRRTSVEPDAPATLPDLEAALRRAIERDPTQPWHLFFLGQTLRATGRNDEAAALWNRMLAEPYEGVRYYEWARMAHFFGRLGQTEWMRRAIARAERMRLADPQPVVMTTMIERLINVAYARRHPRQPADDALRIEMQRSARRVSGVAEADHLLAAAWRAHFERAGQTAAARGEEEWHRRAVSDPLNMMVQATYFDYSIYAAGAAITGFWLIAIGTIAARFPAGRAPRRLVDFRALVNSATTNRYRVLIVVAVAVVAFAVCAGLILAFESGQTWPLAAALLVMLGGLLALQGISVRATIRDAIAAIPALERWVILGVGVVALGTMVHSMYRISILGAAARIPVGIADTFGHVSVRADLEEARQRRDTPEARYAIAASLHAAGEFDQARTAYQSVREDVRVAAALQRLERGDRRIEMPAAGEFIEMFRDRIVPGTPGEVREIFESFDSGSLSLIPILLMPAAAAVLLLALAFAVIRPVKTPAPPPSRLRLLADHVVPGSYDWRRGSAARGAVATFSFLFLLFVAAGTSSSIRTLSAPGLMTALATPNILGSAAFPSDGYGTTASGHLQFDRVTMALAHPWGGAFWTLVILMALFVAMIHARALFALARERRSHATVITATVLGEATP